MDTRKLYAVIDGEVLKTRRTHRDYAYAVLVKNDDGTYGNWTWTGSFARAQTEASKARYHYGHGRVVIAKVTETKP